MAKQPPAVGTAGYPRKKTLSNGVEIQMPRPFLVKDRILARRIVGKEADEFELGLALAAQVMLVDGKPIVYEDLLEWEIAVLDECNSIMGK